MIEYTVQVDEYGNKYWYLNGQLHREDGPAIELADGTKEWYLNGLLHRTDGPAIELANGRKKWYLNGRLHRTDGPAIELADGTKNWYLNDEYLTEAQFLQRTKTTLADKEVIIDGVRYRLTAI